MAKITMAKSEKQRDKASRSSTPSSLLHYTSFDTVSKLLESCLENKSGNPSLIFRASNICCMNDNAELEFILNEFFTGSELKKKYKDKFDNSDLKSKLFVISFSHKQKDSLNGMLPMWRMYADELRGCAIVFDYKKLKSYIDNYPQNFSNIDLKECLYFNTVQRKNYIKISLVSIKIC